MADKEEKKEDQEEKKEESKEKEESSGLGLNTYLITAGILLAAIVGGFSLAQLIGPNALTPSEAKADMEKVETFNEMMENTSGDEKIWYYDIEPPILSNLNEPGVTRMLRAAITLELSPKMSPEKGEAFLEEKTRVLRGFTTTYLAELTLEQVRGSRNLTRLQNELKEHFNELLFPESKPYVTGVIFRDFIIQ